MSVKYGNEFKHDLINDNILLMAQLSFLFVIPLINHSNSHPPNYPPIRNSDSGVMTLSQQYHYFRHHISN